MKRPMAWMGILVLIPVLFLMRLRPVREAPPPKPPDSEVTLIGTLHERQQKNDSFILYLSDAHVTDLTYSGKKSANENKTTYQGVQLWVKDTSYEKLPEIGEKIEVMGKVSLFPEARNPGEFDLRSYYHLRGVTFRLFDCRIIRRSGHGKIVPELLQRLKEWMGSSLDRHLTEDEAGVIKAMILGDRASLSDEVRGLYQRNGIAHVLSISGLHISMLGYGLYRVLKKLRAGTGISSVVSIVFISAYAQMTGGSTSVLRALFMFIICIGADIFGRTYDMLSALSVSLLILLLSNPLMVFDAGFMLSFTAVLGIALLNPWVMRFLPKIKGRKGEILSTISVSLSIQLFTLPVVLYFFYQIPLFSIPLNLVLIPFMGVLIVSAILLAVLGNLLWFPGFPLAFTCRAILLIYEKGCRLCDTIPGGTLILGRPSAVQIFFYYAVLLFLVSGSAEKLLRRIKRASWRKAVELSIIIPMLVVLSFRPSDGLMITMLDIGQGDSILIKSPAGTTYLIDCGSTTEKDIARYRVIPAMRSMGLRDIDYCIMTHPDLDHISGFTEMFEMDPSERLPVHFFVMPVMSKPEKAYTELEKSAEKAGAKVLKISRGQVFKDGDTEISCLHPGKGFTADDVNEYSTVLELKYKGFKALFTGDIQGEGEKELTRILEKEGRIDLLKVAHHGSKNSTPSELLLDIKPRIALISAGKDNSYGHPHKETLERLRDIDADIYTTIDCGAVTLKTDGKNIRLKTFLSREEIDTGDDYEEQK